MDVMATNDKMDDTCFGGADITNAPFSSEIKKTSSWKHIGGTRLEFTNTELIQYGSLECSVSGGSSLTKPIAPKRLIAQRIVPWRQSHPNDESFLLKANAKTNNDENENLDMTTINAMLLTVKSAMVFQDVHDSCQTFVYIPRSLHTASLTEYHTNNKTSSSSTVAVQEKGMKKTKKRVSTTTLNPEEKTTNSSTSNITVEEKEKENEPLIEAVEPEELEKLYQTCLETNEPTPRSFSQIVAKSILDTDTIIPRNLLVSSFQIQNNDDSGNTDSNNPRLLPLQVGIRLALSSNDKFLQHHHALTCKSALSKKSRKKFKKMSPMQVLEDQVLNLLSLLAIQYCDSPVIFRNLVQELSMGVSHDLRNVIYQHFELNQDEEVQEEDERPSMPTKASTNKERVPAVTPATTIKTTVMDPSLPSNKPRPTLSAVQQAFPAGPSSETDILQQKVSLTQSRSTRKNSLVPNQKRKYVGSHFASGLSNVSSLFRQVKVPKAAAAAVAPKRRKSSSLLLEPRRSHASQGPSKRPRTICFERAQQVITETPAKKLAFDVSPHSSFSPMPSHGQNARLVAQQALKAARRKL